jgi:hypothetical protein
VGKIAKLYARGHGASAFLPTRKSGGAPLPTLRSVAACITFLAALAIAPLIGGAQAQNLDQGKSAAKLFADNCASCHHRTRGLAKGRISLTLFLFLQQHYTSSTSSAWALASYLESADAPRGGAARATKQQPTRTLSSTSSSSTSSRAPRPPASVPVR